MTTKKKTNTKLDQTVLNKPIRTVIWEDIESHDAVSLKEVIDDKPLLVETYGKVVRHDKDYCYVMTHYSGVDCDDYLKIPSHLIRKIK